MTTATATATYVFALCRGDGPALLHAAEATTGHAPGGPIRLVRVGTLHAVVQDVPAADFSEDALCARLADQDELERCARAHHAVVTAAARCASTLPLPLATLYQGDERVRAALLTDEPRLGAALDRITGRVEWGVKVYAAPVVPVAAPAASRSPGSDVPGAGRAYLDRVRGRQRQREQRYDAASGAADVVDSAVRDVAVAARRLRLHGPGSTGDQRTQMMNAAYLVAEGRCAELTAVVEGLRRDPALAGVGIELSGPWVPYSFVDAGGIDATV